MVVPELTVRWASEHACHTDRVRLPGEGIASPLRRVLDAWWSPLGSLMPAWDERHVAALERDRIDRRLRAGPLRAGRFYPTRLIDGDPLRADATVFYVLDIDHHAIHADFNHPLSPYCPDISLSDGVRPSRSALAEALDAGPGMQAPMSAHGPDGPADEALDARADEQPDEIFYSRARLVQHLDDTALAHVRALYSRFIDAGMRVLDLMSSWESHLPSRPDLEVAGLGMNREELDRNPVLSERLVHDLNADPHLPFPAARFDVAVCTVSVEYLVDPVQVMREVGRVLVPGAPFVIVFSDRWFPPKVTRLWTELHPFERVGLVAYWMRESGWFTGIATESIRGDRRPADDPHWGQRSLADPVFAVWGRVKP